MKMYQNAIFLLLSSLDDTVIFPILPHLSSLKIFSPRIISVVFGIYPGVMAVVSFLTGCLIAGVRTIDVVVLALVLKSIFSFGFGCCVYVGDPYAAAALVFVSRIGLASCSATGCTAILSQVALESESLTISRRMGMLEFSFGIGAIVGPIVGSSLSKAGGFSTPMFAISFCYLLLGMSVVLDQSSVEILARPSEVGGEEPPVKVLIKNPLMWLSSLSILLGMLSVGSLSQSFFQYLKESLLLADMASSFCYIGGPLAYSLASPVVAALTCRGAAGSWITIGDFLCALGFLMVGQLPWLQVSRSSLIWLSATGNVIFGIGLAFILVSAFQCQFSIIRSLGTLPTVRLHYRLAGMFNTLQSIGLTVGPVFGEEISVLVGFQWMATTLCLSFLLILGLKVCLGDPKATSAVSDMRDDP